MKVLRLTKFRIYAFLGLVFGFGVFFEILRYPAVSQAAEQISPIQIVHQQPDARTLPAPAFMIPLVVEIRNSRSTDLKIRLVASRDGKIMDVALPQGALNPSDNPVYQIQVPAPTHVFSYQFVIQDKDGSITSSKRFVVRRPCIQNYKVEVPRDAADAEFKQGVGELISKAKLLETTTTNYDTSLKLLEQLKTLVSE